jgi:hypothetical protein
MASGIETISGAPALPVGQGGSDDGDDPRHRRGAGGTASARGYSR